MTSTKPQRADLELLLIADSHYVNNAEPRNLVPARKSLWGHEFIRRVLRRTEREGPIDAIVLMGDMVNYGDAPGADKDLDEIHQEITAFDVPVVIVPGNHDHDPEALRALFRDTPGVHQINGYQLLTFDDRYDSEDHCERTKADADLLTQADQTLPIITLQHNPIHPHIESTYPFNLTNAAQVMQAYTDAGVTLSVSAHYHPGIDPEEVGGVTYMTCPALCEEPFRATRISFTGREFSVWHHTLAWVDPPVPLIDFHAHSEFAYCTTDVTMDTLIEHAEALNVSKVHITEHAGQLYLAAEDYWGGAFRKDGEIIRREYDAGRGRMDQFREQLFALRSDRIRVGLEVELDADRKLTLLDEHREGWDILVGAVHDLLGCDRRVDDDATVLREFMRDTEDLVASGIDILAHTFRILHHADRAVPDSLFAEVADLLATHGVAAEINYHTNEPDLPFFRACVDRGVKISLASDGHALWEVGEFRFHLDLLAQIVPDEKLADVLYWGRH